jgi:hypothetical protein
MEESGGGPGLFDCVITNYYFVVFRFLAIAARLLFRHC